MYYSRYSQQTGENAVTDPIKNQTSQHKALQSTEAIPEEAAESNRPIKEAIEKEVDD